MVTSGPMLTVDTVLELRDIHVSELQDGTFCWCANTPAFLTGHGYYSLNKSSGQPDDPIFFQVVEPNPGSPIAGEPLARWVFATPVNP